MHDITLLCPYCPFFIHHIFSHYTTYMSIFTSSYHLTPFPSYLHALYNFMHLLSHLIHTEPISFPPHPFTPIKPFISAPVVHHSSTYPYSLFLHMHGYPKILPITIDNVPNSSTHVHGAHANLSIILPIFTLPISLCFICPHTTSLTTRGCASRTHSTPPISSCM